jgi:DNA-binding NarL/FixJ family response regulator
MIRVLCVDDHPTLRASLRELLDGYDDIEVVGTATDGDGAGRMAAVTDPDVVLMDMRMPGTDGVTGTRQVLAARPEARVVVLTALSDVEHISEAIEAGAVGYVLKDAKPAELIGAIRAAFRGESNPLAAADELRGRRSDGLSDRDVELLRLVLGGDVPRSGGVAIELAGLYRRLGVDDAEGAVRWARHHDIG